MPKRKLRVEIVLRLKAAFTFAFMGIAVSALMYMFLTKLLDENSNRRRMDLLKLFELNLHSELADVSRLKALAANRDINNPDDEWYKLIDFFKKAEEKLNVMAIYYMIRSTPYNVIFILDSGFNSEYSGEDYIDAEGNFALWNTNEFEQPEIIENVFLTGKPAVSDKITKYDWGAFSTESLSSYYPVLKDGAVAGVLGIDEDLDFLRRRYLDALYCLLAAIALSIIVSLLLSANISKSMLIPLQRRSRISRLNSIEKDAIIEGLIKEIRTPVDAINGISGAALRDVESEKAREYLSNIKDAGVTMSEILNRLSELSGVNKKLALKNIEYSVSELMKSCAVILNHKIEERGLKFKLIIDEKVPPKLKGDAVLIKQIVVNLLDNAVNATKEGSIHLYVLSKSAFDKLMLIIRVSDSGIGMNNEEVKRVFETSEAKRSGIMRRRHAIYSGLSLVRGFCALMGGGVSVKSVPGEGSVFTVEIPQKV